MKQHALADMSAWVPTFAVGSLTVRRLVLTARLRPGARERALKLAGSIAAQLETSGFEQLGVYLSEREVVFLIEAREAELLLREILDDPVRATEISPCAESHEPCDDSSYARKRASSIDEPRAERRAMPSVIDRILYTAEATVEGGREGHARTSDGRLDVDLDVPSEMGGPGGPGTNPEQLFAAGYAACFQSSMARFAAGWNLDLTGTRVTARVGIGPARGGGCGLTAALDLHAPGIDRAKAVELVRRAHETCPYSRATRGNIDVTLSVAGVLIERTAA